MGQYTSSTCELLNNPAEGNWKLVTGEVGKKEFEN